MNAKSNNSPIDKWLSEQNSGPSIKLVSIGSQWNGDSHLMRPILDSLEQQYGPNIGFIRLDVERDSKLAEALAIRQLPTLILLYKGQIVDRLRGITPKYQIIQKIEQLQKEL